MKEKRAYKVCPSCGRTLSKSVHFNSRGGKRGGMGHVKPYCKGCEKRYRAGWRERRKRSTVRSTLAKECSRCERLLPASQFSTSPDHKSGLNSRCRFCDSVKRFKSETTGGLLANPRVNLDRCEICNTKFVAHTVKKKCMDHCSETGKFRGILCGACNMALGLLKHDRDRLLVAAGYLDDFKKSI